MYTLAMIRSEPERRLLQVRLASVSTTTPLQMDARSSAFQLKVFLQDTLRQELPASMRAATLMMH